MANEQRRFARSARRDYERKAMLVDKQFIAQSEADKAHPHHQEQAGGGEAVAHSRVVPP